MRIIAGKHRSRQLESVPSNKTRPTLDQVKESLFQRIGPFFEGGTLLDLFAGSGSIGLEALSRGMERVTMVDQQRRAIETIKKNVSALAEDDNVRIMAMPYQKAISLLSKEEQTFDYIYLDPPYDFGKYGELLAQVVGLLKDDGIVLLELSEEQSSIENYLELADVYRYRNATIYKFVKRTAASN